MYSVDGCLEWDAVRTGYRSVGSKLLSSEKVPARSARLRWTGDQRFKKRDPLTGHIRRRPDHPAGRV
jgi:hypothetical protein